MKTPLAQQWLDLQVIVPSSDIAALHHYQRVHPDVTSLSHLPDHMESPKSCVVLPKGLQASLLGRLQTNTTTTTTTTRPTASKLAIPVIEPPSTPPTFRSPSQTPPPAQSSMCPAMDAGEPEETPSPASHHCTQRSPPPPRVRRYDQHVEQERDLQPADLHADHRCQQLRHEHDDVDMPGERDAAEARRVRDLNVTISQAIDEAMDLENPELEPKVQEADCRTHLRLHVALPRGVAADDTETSIDENGEGASNLVVQSKTPLLPRARAKLFQNVARTVHRNAHLQVNVPLLPRIVQDIAAQLGFPLGRLTKTFTLPSIIDTGNITREDVRDDMGSDVLVFKLPKKDVRRAMPSQAHPRATFGKDSRFGYPGHGSAAALRRYRQQQQHPLDCHSAYYHGLRDHHHNRHSYYPTDRDPVMWGGAW